MIILPVVHTVMPVQATEPPAVIRTAEELGINHPGMYENIADIIKNIFDIAEPFAKIYERRRKQKDALESESLLKRLYADHSDPPPPSEAFVLNICGGFEYMTEEIIKEREKQREKEIKAEQLRQKERRSWPQQRRIFENKQQSEFRQYSKK